jgi:hypothetical protein
MIIIWKDTNRNEGILYQDGKCPQIFGSQYLTKLIAEWRDDPKSETSLCEGTHLPAFDGPWPTQGALNRAYAHRFDWMKNMQLHWLNVSGTSVFLEPIK